MKTSIPTQSIVRNSFVLATSVAVLALASSAQAQGITATGTFTDTPNGGGYNYDINLQNSSSSTSPVGTFWFSWIPGQFFLPSDPSSVTPPAGWTDTTPTGSGRFSIEFKASASNFAIAPGGSLDFDFTSADSPATLAGQSAVSGDAVGLSTLYSGDTAFSGNSLQFTVTEAPEPTSLALLAAGSLGCLFAVRRKV
jgi:hypothetical protein